MKKLATLLSLVLLASAMQAMPSGLITKFQAEEDALSAVGSGAVVQAYLEKEMGELVWAVDISEAGTYHQVWVDAHTGTILSVILHLPPSKTVTKQQAEQIALEATSGGRVMQAQRDQWKGYEIWDVAVNQPAWEYDVYVDAHAGTVLKIIKQVHAANLKFINRVKAEQIALRAVGGGAVLLVVLEKSDNPPDWSVDVRATNGREYEVKVNAYTGKVIAIIPG